MASLWPAPVSVRPVAGRLAGLQPAHLVAGLPVLALAAQRGFGDWGLVALAVLGPVAAYAMQTARAEAAVAHQQVREQAEDHRHRQGDHRHDEQVGIAEHIELEHGVGR